MSFYLQKIGNKECITTYPTRYKGRYITIKNQSHLNSLLHRQKSKKHVRIHVSDNISNKEFPMTVLMENKNIHSSKKYDIKDHNAYIYQKGNYPYPDSFLQKLKLREGEKIQKLPVHEELYTYINNFIDSKEFYEKERLFYKSGLLLYGPPGNSKTTFLRDFVSNHVPEDALVVWFRNIPDLEMINELRAYKGLKIFIFEELVTVLQDYRNGVAEFLDFMDGERSVDNSIYIATTNYPEKLPGNVVERPGRFDRIVKFDNPNEETRKSLFNNMFKLDVDSEFLKETEGFSIAQLREVYLQVKIQGISPVESVKFIKNHKEFVKNNFAEVKKLGI